MVNEAYEKNKSSKKARGMGGFMSGVLVLSISTVIVKVIGLGVKIPLLSVLGAVGMGYFNSAYEIYALLCVVSTAGLPTALSMLVSAGRERKDRSAVSRSYKVALYVFLVIGLVGSGAMLIFASPLSEAIGNRDAYFCILAIAPALFLICVSSAVRGYFQGFGYMTPTAVSQLIEALGKLIFGVWFGVAAIKAGMSLPVAAGMSVLGLTLGILISTLYLLLVKRLRGNRNEDISLTEPKSDGTIGRLLKIAFPITLSAAVISSCRIVDMALILRRLQSAGMGAYEANAIYGSYTTLAVPVFGLIPSLITPISLSLIPALTAAVASENRSEQRSVATKAVRLAVLLSMPASMGIALYAKPILSILFTGQTDAIEIAAPLLSVLGASVMFSGLITTTNAILQSHGQTVKPIISMGIGTAIKIVLAYILIGIPEIGAYGAPVSTLACDLTVTVINLFMIYRSVQRKDGGFSLGEVYMRPFFASLGAMAASFAVYVTVMNLGGAERLSFLAALPVAFASYVAFALIFRALRREDIEDIPLGTKLLRLMDNRKIKKMKRKE